MSDWVPDRGEIIWINFDPQAGREQGGHRPALVLSSRDYNGKVGLLVCVPLTTRIKDYAFEVPIAGEPSAVALADHVKSIDWRARKARKKAFASETELATVQARVRRLLE
ncbi:MAG: endoribonuclease MazF [Sphingomicrobium sp.]